MVSETFSKVQYCTVLYYAKSQCFLCNSDSVCGSSYCFSHWLQYRINPFLNLISTRNRSKQVFLPISFLFQCFKLCGNRNLLYFRSDFRVTGILECCNLILQHPEQKNSASGLNSGSHNLSESSPYVQSGTLNMFVLLVRLLRPLTVQKGNNPVRFRRL